MIADNKIIVKNEDKIKDGNSISNKSYDRQHNLGKSDSLERRALSPTVGLFQHVLCQQACVQTGECGERPCLKRFQNAK